MTEIYHTLTMDEIEEACAFLDACEDAERAHRKRKAKGPSA